MQKSGYKKNPLLSKTSQGVAKSDGRAKRRLPAEEVFRRMEAVHEGYRRGLSTKEMAKRLGVSKASVQLLKMKVSNSDPQVIKERIMAIMKSPQSKTSRMEINALERQLFKLTKARKVLGKTTFIDGSELIRENLVKEGIIAKVEKRKDGEYSIPSREGIKIAENRLQKIASEMNQIQRRVEKYGVSSSELFWDRENSRKLVEERTELIKFLRGGSKGLTIVDILSKIKELK